MEIATQLDDNHAEKLTYIQQHTNQALSEILNQAIDLYYEQLNPTTTSPLEVLQEDGLVGCFEGDPDLSKNYKAKVYEYLDQKYPPQQQ